MSEEQVVEKQEVNNEDETKVLDEEPKEEEKTEEKTEVQQQEIAGERDIAKDVQGMTVAKTNADGVSKEEEKQYPAFFWYQEQVL